METTSTTGNGKMISLPDSIHSNTYTVVTKSPTVCNLPSLPSEHEMMVYHTMAEQAVSSKMYRGIGDKAGVMMIMLAARELGIPPMQALNRGINIIQGTVELSARIMSAMIRRAGHRVKVIENDATKCILEGFRCDTGETLTTSFTVEDAKTAGIFKPGGGWTKWPIDMCFARALSRLARQLFSDVIGTAYVEGEIRESECEVIREPQDIVIPVDRTPEYVALFKPEDEPKALQYLNAVMTHYNWSKNDALEHLLKDIENLFTKFNKWSHKE